MFYKGFKALDFLYDNLISFNTNLAGFTGDKISPKGYIETMMTLENELLCKTIKFRFLVVNCPSAYNILLCCSCQNGLGAIISTRHLLMKFVNKDEVVITITGN